ncbi:nucleotidyltransferase family protein [Candidatus Parcubacteria bacterium]|nr:nucleotidyltransferase family protein [Candidatus Parcubacteria bacterium]
MKKITEIKAKILPILKKNDVVRASIFGSFARGEEKKRSDIDMLVELDKKHSLLDLIGIKYEIEDVLKRKVDLLTYGGVNPRLEKYIYKDEIKIYAKRS